MNIKKAPIIFCIARIIPQLDPTCYAFVHFTPEPLSQKNHLYHCVRITQLKLKRSENTSDPTRG